MQLRGCNNWNLENTIFTSRCHSCGMGCHRKQSKIGLIHPQQCPEFHNIHWLMKYHRLIRFASLLFKKWQLYMERHNWHLMLNIYKHTTSYNRYCSYFFIWSIFNIMCDSLNILRCSFLITRSVFVIMRCRSYKWCSSLIITCCAFINCCATFYFMYSRYNIIRSISLIICCSKFITCCGYIFQ